ncbi:MAG: bifunctional 2-polyprenyl-6-hydroxyphenol methylase/3-demethylubiquinol 3-O-methyltransferase UbiG [Gammaproteobacteria bacterium]
MPEAVNSTAAEIAHFNQLASRWWDPDGELRTLHDLNPVRLEWIDAVAGLAGRRVVDVGCGGGLLAEAMARRGAQVTGIDMAGDALAIARLHLQEEADLVIDYQQTTAEELAQRLPGTFEVVTCMELLEHVPDPASLVRACARLATPGGSVLFSTLNRSARAFASAIVGAEYLTGLIPRGTHRYEQFIRPSELDAWGRQSGMSLKSLRGSSYNPASRVFALSETPR